MFIIKIRTVDASYIELLGDSVSNKFAIKYVYYLF